MPGSGLALTGHGQASTAPNPAHLQRQPPVRVGNHVRFIHDDAHQLFEPILQHQAVDRAVGFLDGANGNGLILGEAADRKRLGKWTEIRFNSGFEACDQAADTCQMKTRPRTRPGQPEAAWPRHHDECNFPKGTPSPTCDDRGAP